MKELLNRIKEKWQTIAPREKKAIIVGVLFTCFIVFYQFIWSPISENNALLRKKIVNDRKILAWLIHADQALTRMEKQHNPNKPHVNPVMLLGNLQKQLAKSNLARYVSQLKQASHDTIELHLQKVSFDEAMHFLTQIQSTEPIQILQMMTTASTEPGIVDMDLDLKLM